MEKHFTSGLFLGLYLTLVQPLAYATTLVTPVKTVRVNTGSGSAVRVGIETVSNTACPTTGWFAFEQADTGIGKIWTDLAMIALTDGKQLIITGTGVCDNFGVEGVSDIDLISNIPIK